MEEKPFKTIETEGGGKIKFTKEEWKEHEKMLERREILKEAKFGEKPDKYVVKVEDMEKEKKELEKKIPGIKFR